MKFRTKEGKGITLIALVITIIVLLILAAVTIATLTGENGILIQAGKAKTETNNANIEEQVKLAFLGSYGTDGKLDYSQLARNLEKIEKIEGVQDTITEGSFPLTVTIEGEEIKIFDDGTIFNASEWDKTATAETCFLWGSNNPGDGESYHIIIGYTSEIQTEVKIRIPSRCTKIQAVGYYNSDSFDVGRSFIKNNKLLEIPNTVTEIGEHAFNSFSGLTNVTIPDSVTRINDNAFAGCVNLTNITIPNSVIRMEYKVFEGWTSSQTINIQGYTSAPSGWNANWNYNCSAQINWNQ